MNVPLRWIKQQIEKAERDLEEVQKRLSTWTEALKLAEEAEGVASTPEHSAEMGTQEPKRKRRAGKITDRVEEILKEYGPAKAADIEIRLREMGIQTTANSINTSLNRFRPSRFDRDDQGRWTLVIAESSEDRQDGLDILVSDRNDK